MAARLFAICTAGRTALVIMMFIGSMPVGISIDCVHMEARPNWLKCANRHDQHHSRNESMKRTCCRYRHQVSASRHTNCILAFYSGDGILTIGRRLLIPSAGYDIEHHGTGSARRRCAKAMPSSEVKGVPQAAGAAIRYLRARLERVE